MPSDPPLYENRARDIPPPNEQTKVRELEEYLAFALETIRSGHPWSTTTLLVAGLRPRLEAALDADISPYWRYRPLSPPLDPESEVPDSPKGL